MKKSDRRTAGGQSSQMQLQLPLRDLVREALFDTVIVAGVGLVREVLEEERTTLCGPRYRHDPRRQALRAGSLSSSLSLGGRRVEIERPRVRGSARWSRCWWESRLGAMRARWSRYPRSWRCMG
jgi:hypothetical protein